MSGGTMQSTTTPVLRSATVSDVAAVVELLASSDLPTVGVAAILERAPGDFVVAEAPGAPGTLVGVAGLEVVGDSALLRSVAVAPSWRGHRVGEALVAQLFDEARRRPLVALFLLTTTAERWFPRFGFQVVSRDEVPASVAATEEFSSACPASAVVMRVML